MDTKTASSLDCMNASPSDDEISSTELDAICAEFPSRYHDFKQIGSGGVGIIFRAFDRMLRRPVAIKYFTGKEGDAEWKMARSQREHYILAGLHHPGVVPIYDRDPGDPCRWFVMEPLENGSTLADLIDVSWQGRHAQPQPSEDAVLRLLECVRDAVEVVAFAHDRGIAHLDLKPENIMVAERSHDIARAATADDPPLAATKTAAAANASDVPATKQVYVLDWGLAKTPGDTSGSRFGKASGADTLPQIVGTVRYMAPEQAYGEEAAIRSQSDVFALGLILYEVLTGEPAYKHHASYALSAARIAEPRRLERIVGASDLEPSLASIYSRATAKAPRDRYAGAQPLLADLDAWFDARVRRTRSHQAIDKALRCRVWVGAWSRRIERARSQVSELERQIPRHADAASKIPLWRKRDALDLMLVQAAKKNTEYLGHLLAAWALDATSSCAKTLLFDHYKREYLAAERAAQPQQLARYRELMTVLNEEEAAIVASGGTTLSLATDPPGATVFAQRYESRLRRLTLQEQRVLGVTPLRDVPLDGGSYLLTIEHEQCETVHYPVLIERDAPWDPRRPGDAGRYEVPLPAKNTLAGDDRYVPGGYCRIGGDPYAVESLPAMDVWVDGFLMKQAPVTHAQYEEFIRHLVDAGQIDTAAEFYPQGPAFPQKNFDDWRLREQGAAVGDPTHAINEMDRALQDWPVVFITHEAAVAYCEWRSAQEGVTWRLPHEIEHEKAARGVDGRRYPWGNHFDPALCWILDSQSSDPSRTSVANHRHDVSPYGVTGLAGNVADICMNTWRDIVPLNEGRLEITAAVADSSDMRIMARGGSWLNTSLTVGAASRFIIPRREARHNAGFRLVRSI